MRPGAVATGARLQYCTSAKPVRSAARAQTAVHLADGMPALRNTFPFNRKSRNPETLLPMQLAAATPPFCSWAGSSVTGMAVQHFRPGRMTANNLGAQISSACALPPSRLCADH